MAILQPQQNPVGRSRTGSDLNFQGVPLTAEGSVGTGSRSTTLSTPDPFRDFLLNTILQQTSKTGEIPQFTLDQLQNFTQNPGFVGDIAGQQFQQIIAPLLQSLEGVNKQEQQGLSDLFRKAGIGTQQSGAFAQAGRQLVGDQANRANQLLASNFVPLTGQLSQNVTNAINSGLAVPGATADATRNLVGALGSIAPLQTTTESIGINPTMNQTAPSFFNGVQQKSPTLNFTI